jgi:uncharacterized protein (TIGR02145 family)
MKKSPFLLIVLLVSIITNYSISQSKYVWNRWSNFEQQQSFLEDTFTHLYNKTSIDNSYITNVKLCGIVPLWKVGGVCIAKVEKLKSSPIIQNGSLKMGEPVKDVSILLPYEGGNGAPYTIQKINSTGVLGLSLELIPGNLYVGNNYFKFRVIGTPSTSGSANFSITLAGKQCTITLLVASNQPISGYGSEIKDIDGNTYKTAYIGPMQWTTSNLNTTKYNDGTLIPNISLSSEWSTTQSGAFSSFNNNQSLDVEKGKLYNWFAANNEKICPVGWHVPSTEEYFYLIEYLDGINNASKRLSVNFSKNQNWSGNNTSLFSAIPTGWRNENGDFYYDLQQSSWWTNSPLNGFEKVLGSQFQILEYNSIVLTRFEKTNRGSSIRCVKNYNDFKIGEVNAITSHIINLKLEKGKFIKDGKIILNYIGGNGGIYPSYETYSTGVSGLKATLNSGVLENGNGQVECTIVGVPENTGTLTFKLRITGLKIFTEYTVNIEVNEATILKPIKSGFGNDVVDIDGNSYKTVYIGRQLWMGQNLKVKKYNNSEPIKKGNISDFVGTNFSYFPLDKTGIYTSNDSYSYESEYGLLYNWKVIDNQNICPVGWHVPSIIEWQELSDFLGGNEISGGKLKEKGTSHWNNPNLTDEVELSFNALPGGSIWGNNLWYLNTQANFWAASHTPYSEYRRSYTVLMDYMLKSMRFDEYIDKQNGASIRCVKD